MSKVDIRRHFCTVPVDPSAGLAGLRKAWDEAKTLSGLTYDELGNMRVVNVADNGLWMAVWAWKG